MINKNRTIASLFSNYTEDDEEEIGQHQALKRLALQDTNISRYRREFVEIELIGKCLYSVYSFTVDKEMTVDVVKLVLVLVFLSKRFKSETNWS